MDIKNTRRNKLIVLVIVLSVALILSIRAYLKEIQYDFHYYYSPDKTRTVTRIEYKPLLEGHGEFFVYGRVDKCEVPSSYISPIYSGRDGGFVLLLHWNDTVCTLVAPYGRFDTIRLTPQFKYRRINENSAEWQQMRNDTAGGNNLLLTEYKFE
jgi:hypothetical protein